MMVSRAWETSLLFDHFTNNSWIYETSAVEDMYRQLSPAEREIFVIDPKAIDWRITTKLYIHGIQKYCLKEDTVAPNE